jgi:hypothetical protein
VNIPNRAMTNAYKLSVGKREGKNHSEDLGIDGRLILQWILGSKVGGCGLDSSRSEQGPVAVCCALLIQY